MGIMNENVNLDSYSVEQLKKLKESLTTPTPKTFKRKEGIIDRFTSIDELLIDTIKSLQDLTQEQKETNRQMQINNKLLLALLIEEGADGTMVAKGTAGIDTSAILEEIGRGGAIITRRIDLANIDISGKQIIFEGEFEGGLTEVLFTSSTSTTDNKDYSARVVADDEIVYQDTFTNFESRGGTETDMACFEDEINSWYLLQFQKVNFMNKILVEIYDSSATFLRIYIKYHRSV